MRWRKHHEAPVRARQGKEKRTMQKSSLSTHPRRLNYTLCTQAAGVFPLARSYGQGYLTEWTRTIIWRDREHASGVDYMSLDVLLGYCTTLIKTTKHNLNKIIQMESRKQILAAHHEAK